MILHYDRPAEYWDQALPVGNGRLGAMIYGGKKREHLQLNEESLWSGGPQDRINPDCLGNIERIRELFRQGHVDEAQRLAVSAMSGTPYTQRVYQTLGDLWIDFFDEEDDPMDAPLSGYRRGLDLERAVAWVRYEAGGTLFERQVFASRPADCIVIHMTASGGGRMSFTCTLDRKRHMDFTGHTGDKALVCGGDQHGVRWAMGLRVLASDGEYEAVGAHLTVRRATDVTLVFMAKVMMEDSPRDPEDTPAVKVADRLGEICAVWPDAEALYRAHAEDYRELFDRVKLWLGGFEVDGGAALDRLCTDERLRRFASGREDPGLAVLYFQYGRYLMISGSRPGGLPLTLQGIWNEEFMPPWDSKYTININLEMNYWPVEICGLPECAQPLIALLRRVSESGKETARRMYGCRGFVAHHNTDIHADTAPQDRYVPASYWVMGGAWLSLAVWEHWLFTKDSVFLAEHFDILEQAVLFFRDFLQENERGELVTLPSCSPENSYYFHGRQTWMCEMPAMDIEILTDLLRAYLGAAEELQSGALVPEAREMLEKLPRLRIASDGRLMEWAEEYEEAEPGHRHISHLYGLFPSAQITPEDTPELARAARRTLEYRLAHGGGHTGWSRAWIILFWARLRDGERAYGNLRALLADSTFDNLMDNHPSRGRPRGKVFQIDGNMGAVAGIAEMLVQSHNGRIRILPALPKAWPAGRVEGLRVRGNAQVNIRWRNGRLEEFRLLTHAPLSAVAVYEGEEREIRLKAGQSWLWTDEE